MDVQFWPIIGWLLAACILGFAITFIFADKMRLKRDLFLIPYNVLTLTLVIVFISIGKVDVGTILSHNWLWGVLAGVLASFVTVRHVRSQAHTQKAKGRDLAFGLVWSGFAYGMMDALFLNVMPVVVVMLGISQSGWTSTWPGRITIGILSLLASLLVAIAYHMGYPEFRGNRVKYVFVGNSVITLAFILSGNPLGSMISHTIMHIAAVLQGPDTTIQLPPHYQISEKQG
jgi:hypothetical protein